MVNANVRAPVKKASSGLRIGKLLIQTGRGRCLGTLNTVNVFALVLDEVVLKYG